MPLIKKPDNKFTQEEIKPFGSIDGDWILDESFSDEFSKSKLDTNKWWDFNPAWHGRKPSHFARSNVKVKKGLLRLSAKNLDPKKVNIYDVFKYCRSKKYPYNVSTGKH